MRSNISKFLFAACMTGGIVASVSAPAFAQDANWDQVVAAGKKEGSVTVYNAQVGAKYFEDVIKSFEAKYGIQVKRLDLLAAEMIERVRSEQVSGRYLGDIEMQSDSTIEQQAGEGFLLPHGLVPNIANLRPPFVATEYAVPAFVQAYGMLVNTNLVKPGEEPKTWNDMLDPKWKGKILSSDFKTVGTGNVVFTVLDNVYKTQYHERLATQNVVFSRELRNNERRLARGEYSVLMAQLYAWATELKGLPVKIIVPTDGSPYTSINFAMLKGAPHPNAARLFMNYFLDVQSQLRYGNAGMIPVVVGVIDKVNPDMKYIVSSKLLGTNNIQERPAKVALATKIYK
jgi:ABC-type Fe3+ transport system substrate-binding protein